MLRPLPIDLLSFLLPLGAGVGLFYAGKRLYRLPPLFYRFAVALAVLVVLLLAAAYAASLHEWTASVLLPLGGQTSLTCWAAAFLLGVVWSAPGRSTSSGLLAALVGLVAVILALDGSGRLGWRFFGAEAWRNAPDPDGCLTQTTGWTCGPCAAAMLLHHHGIPTTEGEMAYLADTSWLGADLPRVAAALEAKAAAKGLSAHIKRTDYEACRRRGVPFLARTNIPNVGLHLLYVERAGAEDVELIDPLRGRRERMSRETFQGKWEGQVIYLAANTEEGERP